ncbi:hypothetical protein SO802_029397 [Lithocarpus litseifolius]|uniref:Uncharacterized protein n=1 Tax=Lithocarpus litseifolius TaxID=425828 RepID=A0AAW2BUP2_9ROSI
MGRIQIGVGGFQVGAGGFSSAWVAVGGHRCSCSGEQEEEDGDEGDLDFFLLVAIGACAVVDNPLENNGSAGLGHTWVGEDLEMMAALG